MKDRRRSRRQIGVALFGATLLAQTAVGATVASAQATRTWVSGVGDDANPCSRTAPCKTFAGAISKTAAKGEINVLDGGGFGAVTITKAITIQAVGNTAGVLTNAANAINVSAGVNDVVKLTGLQIDGLATATNGIQFNSGRALILDDLDVFGFSGSGLLVKAAARVLVHNSRFSDNAGNGIKFEIPGVSPVGLVRATLDNVYLDLNGNGLLAGAASRANIRNCTASNNTVAGLSAAGAGGIVSDGCTTQGNPVGISSAGSSVVRVQRSVVVDNGTGLSVAGGSQLLSGGGNTVEGNGADGTFNGSYTAK